MQEITQLIFEYLHSLEKSFSDEDIKVLKKLVAISNREMDFFEKSSSSHNSFLGVYNLGQQPSSLEKVFVDSYSIHHRDFDEMSYSVGGHTMATLYPLSLYFNDTSLTRPTLLKALKVEIALGKIFNPELYNGRFHPTAIIGLLGSTFLSAKYLGLDLAETKHAIGLSLSMMSGLRDNFGSDAKALQVANATKNGLTAALLAKSGLMANINQLDNRNSIELFINKKITSSEIARLRSILEQDISLANEFLIKTYDVCGSFHGLIQTAKDDRLNFRDIESIRTIYIYINPERLNSMIIGIPQTKKEKQFSPKYIYAYSFIVSNMEGLISTAPVLDEVQTFMSKIVIIPDTNLDPWGHKTVIELNSPKKWKKVNFKVGKLPNIKNARYIKRSF